MAVALIHKNLTQLTWKKEVQRLDTGWTMWHWLWPHPWAMTLTFGFFKVKFQNICLAVSQQLLVWLMWNKQLDTGTTIWPCSLTISMTLILEFQGQSLKHRYFRNEREHWHGMKGMWIDCSWPWAWPLCSHDGVGEWTGYSVLPIYRGRVYRRIGYIAVACWTPFFGAEEHDIFREIAVTPWTQFAGHNFSQNFLTAIAFVLGARETIFRETNSSLPVNAGWNTCCAVVSHARQSIDTYIVLQSRVQLIQCQCKSRLQITNLDMNTRFLIKSSLCDHAVYIRHLVQTLGQFRSESRAHDW